MEEIGPNFPTNTSMNNKKDLPQSILLYFPSHKKNSYRERTLFMNLNVLLSVCVFFRRIGEGRSGTEGVDDGGDGEEGAASKL